MHTLFDGLEFRVLRDRLFQTLESEEEVEEATFDLDLTRLAPGELAGWLEKHSRPGELVGLQVQGTWHSGSGDVFALALATGDEAAAWLDVEQITPEDDEVLATWLADERFRKVLHDAKGPILAMAARGWRFAGLERDTALSAYLARPDQRSYDLADLTLRYLKRELKLDAADDGQLSFDSVGDDAVGDTAMLQAWTVLELAAALDQELDQRGGTRLLGEIELPLIGVLAEMERIGVAVDVEQLQSLEAHFAGEVKLAADEAFAVIGKEINLGSPKQLQVVLFDELEMPKTKRTKTGYTTDADALQALYVKTEHPFLLHLLRHRDVSRLRQTVEGLLKTVASDGRIHTTFNQLIAATGRLSSTDPNLQNIPVRTEEGRRIREAFVVGSGYTTLMTADYSQIEMRIMAHLSEDDLLIEAFRSGRDFHAATAARVFDVDPTEVTTEMRAKIKAMNYGLAYGLSAYGLSQQLGIDAGEARGLMDEYFETLRRHPRLPQRRRRRGPPHRLHRDHLRPPSLPARPDQRQPAAPRDGRADGAQRAHPGLGRRHHQGRHAPRRRGAPRGRPDLADAAPGARRARVRGGRGGGAAARGAGPQPDGRCGRADRAARRLGGHRPLVARGGPLGQPARVSPGRGPRSRAVGRPRPAAPRAAACPRRAPPAATRPPRR